MCARKILSGLILCLCCKMSLAAVTVGSCRPDRHSYSTISAAIAEAQAGGVVDVCPGTYAEQLEIDKPLTLRGIDGTPVIVGPATGLNQLPAGSGFYPQVFVNNAGDEVRLLNLSIDGSNALFNVDGEVGGLDLFCPEGAVSNFVGVYIVDTPGTLENINVSNHFGDSFPGGFGEPQLIPNCGSGIVFHGTGRSIVRNSTVSDVGLYGIFSDGDLMADRNTVSGGNGPCGIGIEIGTGNTLCNAGTAAAIGNIINNTITGTVAFENTIGIQGGDLVKDNNVQGSIYGISGAGNVVKNTLQNNAISISGITRVFDNQVSSAPTYFDPACSGFCNPVPTVGVDFACSDSDHVMKNGIQGVGIGFANLPKGDAVPKKNTFNSVQTVSTSCQ
ncbi:MAG TPA: hypothetical protein VK670_08845 [Silvibacterium sp.]|nr:hypothetical protein [Silvibacterium sp.]